MRDWYQNRTLSHSSFVNCLAGGLKHSDIHLLPNDIFNFDSLVLGLGAKNEDLSDESESRLSSLFQFQWIQSDPSSSPTQWINQTSLTSWCDGHLWHEFSSPISCLCKLSSLCGAPLICWLWHQMITCNVAADDQTWKISNNGRIRVRYMRGNMVVDLFRACGIFLHYYKVHSLHMKQHQFTKLTPSDPQWGVF